MSLAPLTGPVGFQTAYTASVQFGAKKAEPKAPEFQKPEEKEGPRSQSTGRRKGFRFTLAALGMAAMSSLASCVATAQVGFPIPGRIPAQVGYGQYYPVTRVSGNWNGMPGNMVVSRSGRSFFVEGFWNGTIANQVRIDQRRGGYIVYGTWNDYAGNRLHITRNRGGYSIRGVWNGSPVRLNLNKGWGGFELNGTWNGRRGNHLTIQRHGYGYQGGGVWNGSRVRLNRQGEILQGVWNGYRGRVGLQHMANASLDHDVSEALLLLLMDAPR